MADTYAKRHQHDADDRDPGFCKCGLAAGAWRHTDTSAYVERRLTAEVWKELRGEEAGRG
ncbi:hypothetical protein [Amycolatopsis circi]|uniref:hypothetical protein n=1 Tax=Amycolatopsis circi TaxID=871959 RepID=UPI000E26A3EC|nr:hypothetical protein [Amycolatopsis circi]